jgi:nucleoside-diphosphate-sugar epimerase
MLSTGAKVLALLLVCSVQLLSGFKHFGSIRGAARSSLSMASKYLGKEPVFVAGGSSGVGLEVVKLLSAMGTPVKVLVRRESAKPELEAMPGVTVHMGDALDEAAVQACMNGCIAAVTTLGGAPVEGQVERVDYAGNSNVIEQAGILGVERIIMVTR